MPAAPSRLAWRVQAGIEFCGLASISLDAVSAGEV